MLFRSKQNETNRHLVFFFLVELSTFFLDFSFFGAAVDTVILAVLPSFAIVVFNPGIGDKLSVDEYPLLVAARESSIGSDLYANCAKLPGLAIEVPMDISLDNRCEECVEVGGGGEPEFCCCARDI